MDFRSSALLFAALVGLHGCEDPRDADVNGASAGPGGGAAMDAASANPGGSVPTGGAAGPGGAGGATASGGAAANDGGAPGDGATAPSGGPSGGAGALDGSTGAPAGGAGDGGAPGAADGGANAAVQPSITKHGESQIALSGLTVISYGGYLNGESFQQDAIVTHRGYQYTSFWNTNRHVVLARRKLPDGAWSKFEFTDYTNTADDAHNTISLGVSPGDGTLHLAFDHHGNDLHYRKSVAGLVSTPESAAWAASSFSAVTSALVGNTTVALVTYPRFVIEPGGAKLLFGARIGTSGSGDEYLWEYDSATRAWSALGKYIDGITDSVNAYPHGLSYTRGGGRLHVSWCWRETPDATTNHDLFYAYSDDHGRSWQNNAGTTIATTGTRFITKNTAGARVWTIGQNRGLINQEHMAVDASGAVHVLLSHMPDARPDDANFTSARTKSQFFHYFRDPNGTWTRRPLNLPSIENFRGKLAVSSTNNVYAILPDLRIAGASAGASYTDWKLLDATAAGRFFSDPLIDTTRLEAEDALTIYYPQKASPNIHALDYSVR